MASGRLIDYLGVGVIADRPAAPSLFADTLGLWYASDTNTLSAWDGVAWENVGGGSGATDFTDLGDVPSTYTGASLKVVRVNAGETGLEFATVSASGDVVGPASAVADSVATFDGTTGKLIKDGGATIADIRAIPQNSQSTAYTLVLADAGKHILHPSADTTARTFTIPANSSVAFPVGTAVTFVNQNAAGVVTIAITTDTMRLAGAGTTGSRTLAANGFATALKITSTEWIINGAGLT